MAERRKQQNYGALHHYLTATVWDGLRQSSREKAALVLFQHCWLLGLRCPSEGTFALLGNLLQMTKAEGAGVLTAFEFYQFMNGLKKQWKSFKIHNRATDLTYGEYLEILPLEPRELPAEFYLQAFSREECVPCRLPLEELLMAATSTKLRWRGAVEKTAASDPGLEKDMKLMELAFRMGQSATGQAPASVAPRTPASTSSSCSVAPQFPTLPPPPSIPALQDAAPEEPSTHSDAGVPDPNSQAGDLQEYELHPLDVAEHVEKPGEEDAVQKLAEALTSRELGKKEILKAQPKVAPAKPKAKSKAKSKASGLAHAASQAKAQKPQKQQKATTKKNTTKKKDQKLKTRAQKQDKTKMKKTSRAKENVAKSKVKKPILKEKVLRMTAKDVYGRAYHQTRSRLVKEGKLKKDAIKSKARAAGHRALQRAFPTC
eukprot:s659_g28.t1